LIEVKWKLRDFSCTCQGISCCDQQNPDRTVNRIKEGRLSWKSWITEVVNQTKTI
jgi:hypothetical protein